MSDTAKLFAQEQASVWFRENNLKTGKSTHDACINEIKGVLGASPEGAGLLTSALLAPDDMPLELVSEGAEHIPPTPKETI